ncbi:sulfatase [Citreimonas sp.]|uniref:sulfatase n=1 Tax=Citreimonas sp. TaxID=3036715 RepID=UPI00405A06F9
MRQAPTPVAAPLGLIAATAILYLVLAQPNHPAALAWDMLLVFPLELPVIVLGLALLRPGRAGQAVRALLVAALTLLAVLKAADFAMFAALARGFNPVGDFPLIVSAWQLTSAAVGPWMAALAMAGAVVVLAVIVALLWWATGIWLRLRPPGSARLAALPALALAAALAVAQIGMAQGRWKAADLPVAPPGAAFTARYAVERVALVRDTWADLRAFRAAARDDPRAELPGAFTALDTDLLVIFVESYGRASHDGSPHADRHRDTLQAAEGALRDAGFAMRSGFVTSPTRGGQSWLAHITTATGLWTDDQSRYLAALASGRQGLFHIAQDAGLHTAAVMPAITLDWPEALRMGFDTVLAAADMGYEGLPFNWVTMPDQFTLTVVDRLRDATQGTLVAQVALISSHAPWVPVPDMVPWDAVGDGRVFDAMAQKGDPPEVVWRDTDRVRAQYRAAIDYSLRVTFDWAARQAGADAPLLIVLGDHQAAGFVAQDDRADVPVHVIGPPDLVSRFDGWGWHDGMLPPMGAPVNRMDTLRDRILHALGPDERAGR